jgi:hypothetical protein
MMQLAEFKNLIANMPVAYQAFASKRATWAFHIDKKNKAGNALRTIFGRSVEVTLSRSDLRNLASKPDLAEFVMATIIWGYPRGMRGNHVENLIGHIDTLTQLLGAAKAQPITSWEDHYANVGPINGIGLSTYTKFLSFLSIKVNGHSALILDDRIIRVANQDVFVDLRPLLNLSYQNAARYYPRYLKCLNTIATELSVSPEQLEFFLFEFGLNLKPSAQPGAQEGRFVGKPASRP